MALDVELYRRTLYTPSPSAPDTTGGTTPASAAPEGAIPGSVTPRRISVIDIIPEGASRTLVFVHGYGGDNLQWINQLRAFAQTARVIAPDLRGHGRSGEASEPAHSISGLVDDLEFVLRELGVQGPIALVAHSFGGAIAAEYTLRHPEQVTHLVLIAVPARFILQPWMRPLMSLPAGLADALARRLKLRLYASIRTLRRMHDGAMARWAGPDRLKQLPVPTLVIRGERDTVFAQQHYNAVPRLVPNAQQVTIPVSSHLVQLERPDATNRAIRRFVEPKERPGRAAVIETMATVSTGGNGHHSNGHSAGNGAGNGVHAGGGAAGKSAAQRLVEMPWLVHYDNEVPQELPLSGVTLPELLGNAARDFPDRAALIFFGQHISYRELDRLSNRFASGLRTLGIQPGERVAIVLPNVPQCVIAFYGTLKAGAVTVMGSSLATEAELAHQLRDADVRAVVTVASYRDLLRRAAAGANVSHLILTDLREYLPLGARLRLARLLAHSATSQRSTAESAEDAEGRREKRGNAERKRNAKDAMGAQRTQSIGTTAQSENARGAVMIAPSSSASPSPSDFASSASSSAIATSAFNSGSLSSSVITVVQSGVPIEVGFQRLLRDGSSAPIPPVARSADLALLQYTSGTTDLPKGVMLSYGNLVFNVVQNRHWNPDAKRGAETILGVLPLSHIYGITACMNMAVALASSLVLLPTSRTKEILRAIKRHSPTIFPGVPAIYKAVANFPHVRRYGIASIRVCVSGSAPLPVEVQEAFEKLTRGRLVEGYGLTEASPSTHCNPLDGERRVGSIGVPLPSTQARVVNLQTGEPLPPGEVGELLVRGPQVMQGYWQRPDETAAVLSAGWLHTGDLARMDEDGFFTVVDRKKDMILAGPYSVYPRDVEEVLYEHPKVFEAVVVAARDAGGQGPIVKAIVVLKRGEKATADELLAFARERLEAYKVPRQIEFRRELPKNLVGKVLRRLLVEA